MIDPISPTVTFLASHVPPVPCAPQLHGSFGQVVLGPHTMCLGSRGQDPPPRAPLFS